MTNLIPTINFARSSNIPVKTLSQSVMPAQPKFTTRQISTDTLIFHSASSGIMNDKFIIGRVSQMDMVMKKKTYSESIDAIDLEIAAMTPEQLVAAILASAGSWADLDNLSDDGFTDMAWGFGESFDIGDSDDPDLLA